MRRAAFKLKVILALSLLLPALVKAGDSAADSQPFDFKLPLGIPRDVWAYFVPKDNPMTADKVALGRELFFDKRLSADGSVSCATCHAPERAFTDGKRIAEGIGGRLGSRNSPTLLNAMFNTGQFWDGRAESLEAQARMPLVNPDEMGNQTHEQIVARLRVDEGYLKKFGRVFAGPITADGIARAIAAFERTLVAGNSPFDRYQAGDLSAMSSAARAGMILFRGKARCNVCHTINQGFGAYPFLSDGNYRNTGVAAGAGGFDAVSRRAMQVAGDFKPALLVELGRQQDSQLLGRFLVTGNTLDIGAFRTPSLRNVELTAPYFHDGSAATLADVVKFYVKGGNANAFRDWQLEPVDLGEDEQRDLVEFLKALTSDEARRLVEAGPQ
ncbi:MAG TPA: cytochrome c peroxidase [Blastocatellia bacterium]|nr:cytochrome c peroxidase [Blastocatellia bacterium]